MAFVIASMQVILVLGIICLAILLYWHFKRINKPVIATIFWVVIFLTSLTPLMQIVQSGTPVGSIPLWYLCPIIVVPAIIINALFFNPLKPQNYNFDEEDDNDEPFEVPDQV